MEGLSCKVVNGDGKEVGSVSFGEKLLATSKSKSLVHQAVRWQRAKKRAGTHSTLTRSNMKGGGKKPWKQKGTGRARAGSINSSIWVGGAVVFGPTPRSYEFKMPKKVRHQALRMAIAQKLGEGKVVVVEDFKIKQGKTKEMVATLGKLGVTTERALLVLPKGEELVWRSVRNIGRATPIAVEGVNVYDVINSSWIFIAKGEIEALQKRLEGK